jgi:hypothetical protein
MNKANYFWILAAFMVLKSSSMFNSPQEVAFDNPPFHSHVIVKNSSFDLNDITVSGRWYR